MMIKCKVCEGIGTVKLLDNGRFAICKGCGQEYEMVNGEVKLVLERDPPTVVAGLICKLAGTGSIINNKVLYSMRLFFNVDEEAAIKLIEGLLDIDKDLDGLSELTSYDVERLREALDKLKKSWYS
jgi:hypothetical protein